MIRRSSRAQHRDVVGFSDSDEIHGEFFVQFGGDRVSAVFRAEDAMNQDVRISVGHQRATPTGLGYLLNFSPRHCRAGLSHTAPYGA